MKEHKAGLCTEKYWLLYYLLMTHSMLLSSRSRRRGEGTLVSTRPVESASKSKLNSIKTPEREPDPLEPDTDTQELSANEPFQSEYVFVNIMSSARVL